MIAQKVAHKDTAVSQNVRGILAAILDFFKILFSAKLQQIFFKFVENMCLLPQIYRHIIKNRVEKGKLEQGLLKSYSFLLQSLICIIDFA